MHACSINAWYIHPINIAVVGLNVIKGFGVYVNNYTFIIGRPIDLCVNVELHKLFHFSFYSAPIRSFVP